MITRCLILTALLFSLVSIERVEASSNRVHIVERGNSWYAIAKIYGCSPGLAGAKQVCARNVKRGCDQISASNSGPVLHIGQKLKIPKTCKKKPRGRVNSPTNRKAKTRRGCTNCNWTERDIKANRGILKKLLKQKGFKAPPKFRAMVVKTKLKRRGRWSDGRTRSEIENHTVYDYGGNSWSHKGWNPASTIKLYSAVSALVRVKMLGFSQNAEVTYHYKRGDKTFKLDWMFEKSAHISKNLPHNRLVQLAGFDFLNGSNGILKQAGLNFSYIMNGYELSNWKAEGQSTSLRSSPRITIREKGKRTRRLKAKRGRAKTKCYYSACTSLSDLAKLLCTLMLHEQLPKRERIHQLDPPNCKSEESCRRQGTHLQWLRQKLNRKRTGRRDPVWKTLEKHFVPKDERGSAQKGRYQLFRKSGWARKWASDVIYIYEPGKSERWIIAMACYGDRYCLGKGKKNAAELISQLIKSGKL